MCLTTVNDIMIMLMPYQYYKYIIYNKIITILYRFMINHICIIIMLLDIIINNIHIILIVSYI